MAGQPGAAATAPTPSRSALVIDDSRTMRSILARILGDLGWTSQGAADGREALGILATGCRPSLVLVDWNMPVLNGLDFVRAVRANAAYAAIPLVMVSTESELDQIAHALDAGADEYILKPFTPGALADKLEALFGEGGGS